ncbi:hypothetical protein NDU88_003368 [Pleurodeles waltl]|uniref:Uncharacterized protein n=1 Tax=Pleurodeles waltl TaxID=8319 RepID=A0AAV7WSV7_PLEWA|nr:hypothetical protein NDU88_003368 [Pleurodeles waltl]
MLGWGVQSHSQYLVLNSFRPLVRTAHIWLRSVRSARPFLTLDSRPPSRLIPVRGLKIPCGVVSPPPFLALEGVGAPVVQSSRTPLRTVLGAPVP